MRVRRTLGLSVVVAGALIPVVLRLGHERSTGCDHPTHYPCDPFLVIPGWVMPFLAVLGLWIVAVGLGLALTGARRWSRSHDRAARTVAHALRWSAVAAVVAMPAALWLLRSQPIGC